MRKRYTLTPSHISQRARLHWTQTLEKARAARGIDPLDEVLNKISNLRSETLSNNNHEKACEYCGATEPETKQYQINGKYFCSREHFMKFHEEHSTQHLAPSNSPLDVSEVATMEQSHRELYGPHSKFAELSYEQKVLSIQESERRLFELRAEIMAKRRALNLDENNKVSEQLAAARKFGPEIKSVAQANKLQGRIEKTIASYYEGGMTDDTIVQWVVMGTSLSEAQARDEISNLRAKGLIGPPRSVKDFKLPGMKSGSGSLRSPDNIVNDDPNQNKGDQN